MVGTSSQTVPSPWVCEQARTSRDVRFDGLFFTAVTSTRIYCRPICPVPLVKREHVRYYPSAAAAEAAGFRPCLRCRPELSPGARRCGDDLIERALKLIDQGLLAEQPLSVLAERVGLGERQLRRLFVERLGVSPSNIHATHRLLFAKKLLSETDLPIIEVALEAGFSSLRRFNASFRQAYRMAPSELRRKPRRVRTNTLMLRLGYRPPYDYAALLDFLRVRALPGVEAVGEQSYTRVFGPPEAPGWLRVSRWPRGEHALQLQLDCPRSVRILDVVIRLRRMFDLDTDAETIVMALSHDERLRPLLERRPGLRLPGGWDGFEIAVRAVLGQRISVAAARNFAARLVQGYGQVIESVPAPGLERLFPTPEALAKADLTTIGLSRDRAQAVRRVAQAVLDGRVDFQPERTLDNFVARWTALPDIGVWTAHYIALRALSHPDAFPADDLMLRRASNGASTMMSSNTESLSALGEGWRPWRAYAVIHLWQSAARWRRETDKSLRHGGAATEAARRIP